MAVALEDAVSDAVGPPIQTTRPPQSRPIFGSLSLKNWPCLPEPALPCPALPCPALPACLLGPAGPPIASRSASEPRERRHRSLQKQRPAPGGAQDSPGVGALSSPAPPGPLLSLEGTGGARKASLPPG